MFIDFRYLIRAQTLCTIERVRHRCNPVGFDSLKLIDELQDVGKLRLDVSHLFGADFEACQQAELLDVFSIE